MILTHRLGRKQPWWLLVGTLAYILLITFSSAASVGQGAKEAVDDLHVIRPEHLRKRSPQARSEEPSGAIEYPGRSIRVMMHDTRKEPVFYFLQPEKIDEPVQSRFYENLSPEERKILGKFVPLEKARLNNWRDAKKYIRFTRNFNDRMQDYIIPGYEQNHITIFGHGEAQRYQYSRFGIFGLLPRKTVRFEKLPRHLRDFLDAVDRNPATWAARHPLKRRSLSSVTLQKRNGPKGAGTSTGGAEVLEFPGHEVLVRKLQSGYVFTIKTAQNNLGWVESFQEWQNIASKDKERIRQAYPAIEERLGNTISDADAGLEFKHDETLRPSGETARKMIPNEAAESLTLVRKISLSRPWRTKYVFLRRQPRARKSFWPIGGRTWSFEELPDHLQRWLRGSRADVVKKVSHPVRKRAPPPGSDRDGRGKILEFPGNGVTLHKYPTNYRFTFTSLDPAHSNWARIFERWEQLNPSDQARIRQAFPRIEDVLHGRLSDAGAGLTFASDGTVTRMIPSEADEKLLLVRKKSMLPFGQVKYKFLRFAPGTSQSTSWSLKELPEHLQKWLKNNHSDVIRRIEHSLRKRAPPPGSDRAASGSNLKIFSYPGENVYIHRIQGPPMFSLPSVARPNEPFVMKPWRSLKENEKNRFRRSFLNIDDFLANPAPFRQSTKNFKYGIAGLENVPTWTIPVEGEGPEVVLLDRKVDRRTGNNMLLFRLFDPVRGIYSHPLSLKELPQHLQDWFKGQHNDIFIEASGHRLRKRAPPQRYFVSYPGEKIVLFRTEDSARRVGKWQFTIIPAYGTGGFTSRYWETLPHTIRNHFRNIPHMREVATGSMSREEARALHIRVGDHASDERNAYFNPDRPSANFEIFRNSMGKIVIKKDGLEPVELHQLPEYLRDFLRGHARLRGIF